MKRLTIRARLTLLYTALFTAAGIILFTPVFIGEARRMGEARALETFRDCCFERAPRPEPDAEYELQVLGAELAGQLPG